MNAKLNSTKIAIFVLAVFSALAISGCGEIPNLLSGPTSTRVALAATPTTSPTNSPTATSAPTETPTSTPNAIGTLQAQFNAQSTQIAQLQARPPLTPTVAAAAPTITTTNTRVPPTSTPTATTTCNGSPKIESFVANPNSIVKGASTKLEWGLVGNAESAEIDQGIGGIGTPGSVTLSPASTTTYTMIARCGANTTVWQVVVFVNPPSVVVNPTPVLAQPQPPPPANNFTLTPTNASDGLSPNCRDPYTVDDMTKQPHGFWVRVSTEPCAYTHRTFPATFTTLCPKSGQIGDVVCTFDVSGDKVIHEGIDQVANGLYGATLRFLRAGYGNENVCSVWKNENADGQNRANPFAVRFQPVPGGTQTCQ